MSFYCDLQIESDQLFSDEEIKPDPAKGVLVRWANSLPALAILPDEQQAVRWLCQCIKGLRLPLSLEHGQFVLGEIARARQRAHSPQLIEALEIGAHLVGIEEVPHD